MRASVTTEPTRMPISTDSQRLRSKARYCFRSMAAFSPPVSFEPVLPAWSGAHEGRPGGAVFAAAIGPASPRIEPLAAPTTTQQQAYQLLAILLPHLA